MRKILLIPLALAFFLAGCNKSKPASMTSSNDPVERTLQTLAGGGAKNCGVLKSQAATDLEPASKCSLEAAKAKTPFYVEYQLPGMTVAVAGNADGKLFAVQSQAGGAGLTSGDCPAEIRVAPSGRVTCYAPGTFPMGAGAGSHSNMTMPPAMSGGPHGTLPPGHPSPQQPADQPPKQ